MRYALSCARTRREALDMSIPMWKVDAGKLPSHSPHGAYSMRTFLLNERDFRKVMYKWKDLIAKLMS